MLVCSVEPPATSFGFSGTGDLRASVSCSAVQPATSIGSAGSPERLFVVLGPVVDRLLFKCACWVAVPNRRLLPSASLASANRVLFCFAVLYGLLLQLAWLAAANGFAWCWWQQWPADFSHASVALQC